MSVFAKDGRVHRRTKNDNPFVSVEYTGKTRLRKFVEKECLKAWRVRGGGSNPSRSQRCLTARRQAFLSRASPAVLDRMKSCGCLPSRTHLKRVLLSSREKGAYSGRSRSVFRGESDRRTHRASSNPNHGNLSSSGNGLSLLPGHHPLRAKLSGGTHGSGCKAGVGNRRCELQESRVHSAPLAGSNSTECSHAGTFRPYPWLSGTNRSATRRLPTASSIVSYITLIAWSYAVSPYAKQKLSVPNPKPKILVLPNHSSRSRDAGDKGAQTPPLSPAPQIPALPVELCSNQLPNLPSNQRLVCVASLRNLSLLIFPNFFLTIPITSYTSVNTTGTNSGSLMGFIRGW
jgi:hypothetical protein